MRSKTIKENGVFAFWIELHELDAEYTLNDEGQVQSLTVYPKREVIDIEDSMRRAIRKGGDNQLRYNKIRTKYNILAIARLSKTVTLANSSSMQPHI